MDFFINGSDSIANEGKKILDDINTKVKLGLFNNNTELTYKYKEKILGLYDDIHLAKFKPCYAKDTLLKDEYMQMITTLALDIEDTLNEVENISKVVDTKTDEIDLIKKSLLNTNRLINMDIDNLKKSVEDYAEIGLSSFIDSFNEDESNSSNNIKNQKGFLTLPYKSYQDLSSSSIIEVLDTNALPGNTHVATESYSNIVYDGEIDPMLSLANILDNNNETRFECEMFEILDSTYEECNGAGFRYKEGVSWITEDNKIYLKIRLSLSNKQVANWFSITPYIPPTSTYINSVIKTIIISDGNNDIKKMIEDINFNDTVIIPFKEMEVKYVDILIEQSNAYDVDVAHDVVTKLNSNKNYLDTKSIKVYERENVSIRNLASLGVKYDTRTKKITIPKSNEKSNVNVNNLNNIFGEIMTDSSYEYRTEIIKAKRYNISILNANLGNYSFEDEYTYTSKPFSCSNDINSIILNASDSLDDDNIKYYITLDSGSTWIRIYPKERAYKGACCIKINSTTPLYERDPKIIYVDKLTNVRSIILKIELTKPTDNSSIPIVYNYRLNVSSEVDHDNR